MRHILFFLLFYTSLQACAQNHYRIFFTDKGDTTNVHPSTFLSPQSVERRRLQGIKICYTDYPIYPYYLKQLRQLGIAPLSHLKWFNCITAKVNHTQLQLLRQLPFVAKVVPIYLEPKLTIAQINTDTFIPDYKGIPIYRNQLRISHTDVLNAAHYRGQGKIIAIMDDGFLNLHQIPAFRHLFMENRILGTYDFVDNDPHVYTDGGGHGTLVLSNIAAIEHNRLYGAAYEASLILCRTENVASESRKEGDAWAMAAEYADSLGADIFSTSLGYGKGMTDSLENYTYADMDGNTTLITQAADMAASKGILVINSAGNEGAGSWKYITAPADGDSVLTVGAVDSAGIRANFSSIGPTSDGRLKPELVITGVRNFVIGTDGNVYRSSGTSFSCPLMSGLAASLWGSKPTATAWQIREALIRSGHQYNKPDTFIGYGIPDARKAFFLLHGYYLPEPVDSAELNSIGMGIYPNPASDRVRVVIENRYQSTQAGIEIYNHLGQLVKEGTYTLKTDYNEYYFDLTIAGMVSGIYQVVLLSEVNLPIAKQKLLVVRY